jgi:hypothetical protein
MQSNFLFGADVATGISFINFFVLGTSEIRFLATHSLHIPFNEPTHHHPISYTLSIQ